jgi:adenylate cyclase
MTNKSYWTTLFSLGCLGIYLFVTVPPPLADQKIQQPTIPVEQMFTLLQSENAAARWSSKTGHFFRQLSYINPAHCSGD